jgi:hypothetical protein
MVESILGPSAESAGPEAVKQVRDEVMAYIDRSTGVQTLTQMGARGWSGGSASRAAAGHRRLGYRADKATSDALHRSAD